MYMVLYNEGGQRKPFVNASFTVHVSTLQWWMLNLEWLTKPIRPFFSRLSGSTGRWGRRSGSGWSGPGRARWTCPTRSSRLQGGRHATHYFLQLVYSLLVIPILSLHIAKLLFHLLFLSAFLALSAFLIRRTSFFCSSDRSIQRIFPFDDIVQ